MPQITVIQGQPTEAGAVSFPHTETFLPKKRVTWDVTDGNAFVSTDNVPSTKYPKDGVDGFSDNSTSSITVTASGTGHIKVLINY